VGELALRREGEAAVLLPHDDLLPGGRSTASVTFFHLRRATKVEEGD